MKKVQEAQYLSYHGHSAVNLIVLLFCLLIRTNSQASPTYNVPSQGIQTNAVTLIIGGQLTNGKSNNNITFEKRFVSTPSIVLGLAGLNSLNGQIALFQQATSRTLTYFTHKLTLQDLRSSIQYLKITYLAINLIKFYYVYPHSLVIEPNFISSTDDPDSQQIQVQYLNPLSEGSDYNIGVVMSGFWINSNSQTYIGVQAQLSSIDYYLVKMTVRNGTMRSVQIGRILIDKTTQSLQTFAQYYKIVQIGRITHYQTYQTMYLPHKIDFYEKSKFFGITYFQNSFIFLGSQIGVAPNPTANVAITSVVFMQYLCPSTYPFYQPSSMTCFSSCSVRLYQVDLSTCGRCIGACYQCTGPLIGDCIRYLPQQSYNTSTNIVCNDGYTSDSITGACKSCSSYVLSCVKCSSTGACTQCSSGCLLQSSSVCQCSNVCLAANKMISPITGACICKPQYYQVANGTCLRCQRGCYICQNSASNCSVCIDRYQLYQSSCIIFQHSSYMIDQNNVYISEESRCIQKIQNTCKTYCDKTLYMYTFKCFQRMCPSSTFGFVDIYSGGLCQPCRQNCIDCDVYYVCKLCISDGYYLSGAGQCVACMHGCKGCNNPLLCLQCNPGYVMDSTNTTCVQILPTNATSCGLGCKKCLIDQYCQQCQASYTRIRDSYNCTKCDGVGFIPNYTNIIVQSGNAIQYTCKQYCGDGLLFIDQCDDGNNIPGDGCSQSCTIQDDYICQYLTIKKISFCILSDYQLQVTISKNLTSNQVNITVYWNNGSSVLLQYNCPTSMTLLYYTIMNSSCTYTFSYNQSIQNQVCIFSLAQSQILQPLICNISTNPGAIYYNTNHILLKYPELVFSYIAKPLAYMTWILSILSIDPFSILINHTFIYLYLATLYEFSAQPPSVYGMFTHLKFFAFDEISPNRTDALQNYGMMFVQGTYRMLILFAICIVYQEAIVRFMKNNLIFADCQCKIFQNIFRNRLTSYICIFNTLQPILALYLTSIIFQTNQSQINRNIIGFVVVSVHLLGSVMTIVLIFVNFQYMTNNKYNVKYLYFICVVKWLSVLGLLFCCYSFGLGFLFAAIVAASLFVFVVFVLFDCSSQQLFVNSKESDQLSQSSSNTIQHTYNACTQSKSTIRKINTLIQVSAFIAICIVRILYIQHYNQQLGNQFYGIIINILFLGSLCGGFVLHLIQIFITLGIFITGDLEIYPDDKEDNNQTAGQGQTNKKNKFKKKLEQISVSQLSRVNLKP